jgi:CheY-like chemotaxis protein
MKKKLNCVLLIDDDKATNFINERVIKKLDCTKRIVTVYNGAEALEFLSIEENGNLLQPDLIFLDINMPVMDGWELLEHYRKLHENKKAKVVLLMLTTSLNPDDVKKANRIEEVKGFKNKPLTIEMMQDILKAYFQTFYSYL